ncbi:hypothetical protein MBLNU13_g08120t2 [Cladosporium sp. NU13]
MLCVFKLRILQDLWDLNAADFALGNKLPAELFNDCRSYLDLLDLRAYIDALDANYFDAIANPDKYKKMQPAYEPELPITEALAQTCDAWAETPGAYAMFQAICTRDNRESEDEDDD